MIAKVFLASPAVLTALVRAVKPRNSDASAALETSRALTQFFNHSYDLMSRNYRRLFWRKFALDHVQICAAYAAHLHAHQNFASARLRPRNVDEFGTRK